MTDVLGRLTAALTDRYAIVRELGAGGMATVHLAHDVKHDCHVALKMAYVSDETGRDEVYVRPFPGPGGRSQISSGGGTEPRWSPTGRETCPATAARS